MNHTAELTIKRANTLLVQILQNHIIVELLIFRYFLKRRFIPDSNHKKEKITPLAQ